MEADWEVEIGGGAPVIETDWPGFVDLRADSGRIAEIAEAVAFPPLAALLLVLNAPESPAWTSKCDVWEPESGGMASYIDMLPREGAVFAEWEQGAAFCREYVARLAPIAFLGGRTFQRSESGEEAGATSGSAYTIELIVRQAVAGEASGFGVTAYLSVRAATPREGAAARITAAGALARVIAGFADALPSTIPPAKPGSKLQ